MMCAPSPPPNPPAAQQQQLNASTPPTPGFMSAPSFGCEPCFDFVYYVPPHTDVPLYNIVCACAPFIFLLLLMTRADSANHKAMPQIGPRIARVDIVDDERRQAGMSAELFPVLTAREDSGVAAERLKSVPGAVECARALYAGIKDFFAPALLPQYFRIIRSLSVVDFSLIVVLLIASNAKSTWFKVCTLLIRFAYRVIEFFVLAAMAFPMMRKKQDPRHIHFNATYALLFSVPAAFFRILVDSVFMAACPNAYFTQADVALSTIDSVSAPGVSIHPMNCSDFKQVGGARHLQEIIQARCGKVASVHVWFVCDVVDAVLFLFFILLRSASRQSSVGGEVRVWTPRSCVVWLMRCCCCLMWLPCRMAGLELRANADDRDSNFDSDISSTDADSASTDDEGADDGTALARQVHEGYISMHDHCRDGSGSSHVRSKRGERGCFRRQLRKLRLFPRPSMVYWSSYLFITRVLRIAGDISAVASSASSGGFICLYGIAYLLEQAAFPFVLFWVLRVDSIFLWGSLDEESSVARALVQWDAVQDDEVDWGIFWPDIHMGNIVGEGQFAVWSAMWLGTPVAVKRVPYRRIDGPEADCETGIILAEMRILRSLAHPNIVQFLGYAVDVPSGAVAGGSDSSSVRWQLGRETATGTDRQAQTQKELWVVMEFLKRNSLWTLLETNPRTQTREIARALQPWRRLHMAVQICRGMHYLASRGVIHRDLKSANVFVGDDFRLKIGDFGESRVLSKLERIRGQVERHRRPPPPSSSNVSSTSPSTVYIYEEEFHGSLEWSAPEVLSDLQYSTKSDVYSFGIVLWELISRDKPFMEVPYNKHFFETVSKLVVYDGMRPALPSDLSGTTDGHMNEAKGVKKPPSDMPSVITTELSALLRQCWAQDASDRPTFDILLTHLVSLCSKAKKAQSKHRKRNASTLPERGSGFGKSRTENSSSRQLSIVSNVSSLITDVSTRSAAEPDQIALIDYSSSDLR